ncbi:MAG: hypothetical protein HRU10_13980 [Opitutales bacterium]|nr:hypothetical protein [Opitutales bacterium]
MATLGAGLEMALLYHVSSEEGIERFEPRDPPSVVAGVDEPCVWAIDDANLVNYLLPRDCPRVTFYPNSTTSEEDLSLLGGPFPQAKRLIAIEDIWLERALTEALWIYTFEAGNFEHLDAGAGNLISREAVVPIDCLRLEVPLFELVKRDVELRIVPSLWPLHDAVIKANVQFSIIRMRNAKPRNTQNSAES